ncbi:hypothetical protein D3C72_2183270 [compost metagenome]
MAGLSREQRGQVLGNRGEIGGNGDMDGFGMSRGADQPGQRQCRPEPPHQPRKALASRARASMRAQSLAASASAGMIHDPPTQMTLESPR